MKIQQNVKVLNAVALYENLAGQFHVEINKIDNHGLHQFHDFWNGTRFLLNRNLFPEKLSNFQGKILK